VRLLERDAELAALGAACESASHGDGRLVLVEGAAGIGKSALLARAADLAVERGLQVLRARGSELESDFAFGVIRQLYEPVLARASAAEQTVLLAGAAGPAARLFAVDGGAGAGLSADGAFAVLHGIYWLTSNLTLRSPVALIVDDVHWCDPSSVRALAYLAHRIGDLPAVMIVAMRPAEPDSPAALLDELRCQPNANRVILAELHQGSVARLVRAELPAASEALCAACYSATAGNPFYLRELLVTVAAEHGRGVSGVAVTEVAVPTLGDRIIRRLRRIGPNAVDLARAMSVLGEGGHLADAAAIAGLAEPAAAAAAAAMARMGVLAAADPIAFVHPLVRRCMYDTLSVAERDRAHRTAASRLVAAGAPTEATAVHLAACRPARRPQVAAALRNAAGIAMRRAAPETAARWLIRALAENATEPPRAVLLHELGRVEAAGREPSAITHLREALDLTADPIERGQIAVDLSEILVAAGQWEAGVTAVSDAVAGIDGDLTVAPDLAAIQTVAWANDPRLAASFDDQRTRLLQLTTGPSWSSRALAVTLGAVSVMRGDCSATSRALLEDGLRDWQLFADHSAGGFASAQALIALTVLDADERATEVADALYARAAKDGALIGTLTAMGYRCLLAIRRGELALAEADMRTCLQISLQNGMQLLVATAISILTDAILERPSLSDIAVTAEEAELSPDFAETCGGAMLLEARGRLRVARGARDTGVADLRAAGRVYRGLRYGPPFSFWRSHLALALSAQHRDEALELTSQELQIAAATGLPRAHGIALRHAGLVVGGERGMDWLEASVQALSGTTAKLEYATSLVELGAALRRAGQRTRARESLSAGLDLAHHCGAERLTSRTLLELQAAGARPRRIAQSGLDALTASEFRAAHLVSQGRTNPEVAQALFVSLKTVETHLSHAYAKLGLSGPGARLRLAELFSGQRP
jgi:DNA-binding CsgD family transcriptional regulator